MAIWPFCRSAGLRRWPGRPLRGGRLFRNAAVQAKLAEIAAAFGVDETAVAVAWLLRHPAGILPVMGTNSLDRIARLSDALKLELDRQSWFELYTLALGREVP